MGNIQVKISGNLVRIAFFETQLKNRKIIHPIENKSDLKALFYLVNNCKSMINVTDTWKQLEDKKWVTGINYAILRQKTKYALIYSNKYIFNLSTIKHVHLKRPHFCPFIRLERVMFMVT